MQGYRAYILGPDGHVQERIDLHCANEAEAIEQAERLGDDLDVELWQLDRFIKAFRHTRQSGHC